jgi:nicotinate dehydrogenase subunit B
VAVQKDGGVQVKRVVIALDVGEVLNPDGLRQQAEGAVMMGLGYALSEEVRFQGGKVLTGNFDDYRIPRFSSLPKIEIVLVDNPQSAALGGGEPPIIAMGAVLANAIYDGVGARLLGITHDAAAGQGRASVSLRFICGATRVAGGAGRPPLRW